MGCPGHPGNEAADGVWLGQRQLFCGAEPGDGQLPQRGSECWGEGEGEGDGGGDGVEGVIEGSGARIEIRGRERVERMEETNLQLQTRPFDTSKDLNI